MSNNDCMKILIQCGDHFENQKRISILVRSLLQRNQIPIVLMYKKGTSSGNIFKVMGVEVVYLSDYITKSELDIKFSSKIYNDLTVMDFAQVEIARNPRLGWSSQVKKTSNTTLSHLNALSIILQIVNPNHVVIWNGFTGFVANVLRVLCKYESIATSFLERGLLKNSLFVDDKGVNGASSLSLVKDYSISRTVDGLSLYVQDLFFDKEDIDVTTNQDRPEFLKGKKVVFFPLQVQLDTNILLYSPYNTMREVFFEIYKKLNSENTFFIIRPHPEELETTLINIPILDNVLVSKDESLEYWLNLSDLVVTVNSTVGLEALIKGKSIICLGQSVYSSLPCLSSYNALVTNKSYILKNTKDYLGYLLTHNLLVENSPYNGFVINNVFNIGNDVSTMDVYIQNDINSGKSVFCDFSFSSKINLTYRKFSVDIDLNWIDGFLRPVIGDYDFVENINNADIVITDQPFECINFLSNKLYFDIYGIRLR